MRRRLVAVVLLVVPLLASCDRGSEGPNGSDEPADSAGSSGDRTSTTTAEGDAATDTTAAGDDATTTSGDGGPAPAPTTTVERAGDEGEGVVELTITGGAAEGGVRREVVKQGAQVTIRATSDVADELHVHTYDLKVDLVPGQSADITFLARVPGVFEVELERRGNKVLELEVQP